MSIIYQRGHCKCGADLISTDQDPFIAFCKHCGYTSRVDPQKVSTDKSIEIPKNNINETNEVNPYTPPKLYDGPTGVITITDKIRDQLREYSSQRPNKIGPTYNDIITDLLELANKHKEGKTVEPYK